MRGGGGGGFAGLDGGRLGGTVRSVLCIFKPAQGIENDLMRCV